MTMKSVLAACKLAELNRSWPPFLNANKQPKGTLCVQLKKGLQGKGSQQQYCLLDFDEQELFWVWLPGLIFTCQGAVCLRYPSVVKKENWKVFFCPKFCVGLLSTCCALRVIVLSWKAHIDFTFVVGVSRGSRGGSGILKKQTPFRTPSDGSGSVQQLRKGVKNLCEVENFEQHTFFWAYSNSTPKKSMRHNFIEDGMKFLYSISILGIWWIFSLKFKRGLT